VDGGEVLREACERGRVPVVVLTARSTIEDRINGLRLGADDYVTKPFSPTEVVLRVGAVLQRARGAATETAPVASYGEGRLRIDEARPYAPSPAPLPCWSARTPAGCTKPSATC
jgi:DNA-binding response OmpR family regulator